MPLRNTTTCGFSNSPPRREAIDPLTPLASFPPAGFVATRLPPDTARAGPSIDYLDGVGEAAAEEQPPSPGSGGAAASSPMLVGSGDQAPRPSRLVGLPIKWRPLFPTTAYTYTITNPDVLTAVAKSSRVCTRIVATGLVSNVLLLSSGVALRVPLD